MESRAKKRRKTRLMTQNLNAMVDARQQMLVRPVTPILPRMIG